MNPRHRRLLIPGLLTALLVVVVIASIVDRSDAAELDPAGTAVSTIDDPRITEASGLAVSRTDSDLGYVINDSGQAQELYAVQISTGTVVGVTAVTGGTWSDTEALAIDEDGMLWIADTGDNLVQRDDAALYALPEPGRGDSTAEATRYPVSFEDGPRDAEALLVQPGTGATFLISKSFDAGDVYALPDELVPGQVNLAERVAAAPGVVTDAAFTPDGESAILRTYGDVRVHDPADWSETRRIAVLSMQQSESLAVEPGGTTFLLGSEGEGSPLVRVSLDAPPPPTASPTPTPDPVPVDANGDPRENNGFAGRSWFGVAFILAALVGVSAWIARGR
ncbi:hypothetical protein [Aeromicrobium sp. CF3.5]|uniref:hypothetical protein n=1 Tax=Aeromicrobium sp. CF3.5 TaxID=3373078 RepID=UPI003EE4C8C2